MAANYTGLKASLAIGAAGAVIWGSLYFSGHQSFASAVDSSVVTTTGAGTAQVVTAPANSTRQTAQAPAVRRTRRS